jgi:hypothetical protein
LREQPVETEIAGPAERIHANRHRMPGRWLRTRVIYYWHVPRHRIYLLYGYVKSKREDLTLQQVKVLAELMKGLKDG